MKKNISIKRSRIADFIWNMIGGGLVAIQAALILVFVARNYGQEVAGIITIAYAIGTLAFTISRYGIRNYQVTDSNEKYSFFEYLKSRILSVAMTLVGACIYLFFQYGMSNYTLSKTIIVLEVILLRLVDAFEDVYLGRFQQMGYFRAGAQIMAVREMAILLLMIVLLCFKTEITIVFSCAIILGVIIDICGINYFKEFLCIGYHWKNSAICATNYRKKGLLCECLPLCVGTTLAIYVSNIPKYVADSYLDDYMQAIVGYLFLPIFTIALLNQFTYTPFIKQLGDILKNRNYIGFTNKIKKQVVLITITTLAVFVFSFVVGIPLLSLFYDIDLSLYRKEFVVFLMGGGLYALEYYLAIPITILNRQGIIAIGYIVAILLSFVFQNVLVSGYGLMGIAYLYLITNFCITVFFIFVIKHNIRSRISG